jgi:hypothetical protein
VSFVRGRSSTSITAQRTCPCRCSHSIGSERNICCPQSWRAAKFLMQVSEHPTDLFAGPAAVDPVFLSQGDGFGIVVAVVAASRNLSLGRRTFRESLLVGKFMVGSCQGACPVIPSLDTGLWLQQPFVAPPTPSVEPAPWPPPRDIAGAAAPEASGNTPLRGHLSRPGPCLWIERHGGLTSKPILLRGRELAAMFPRCS